MEGFKIGFWDADKDGEGFRAQGRSLGIAQGTGWLGLCSAAGALQDALWK